MRHHLFFSILALTPAVFAANPIVPVTASAPAPAAKPCSIEERKTKSGLSYVRFTGRTGLRTDILYAPHMDPSMLADLQTLLSNEIKTPATFKTIKELANKVKSTHREITAAKRRELALLDDLTEGEKIRWLGVELPESDVAALRKHIVLERIKLEKLLTDAGVSLRDSDDMVLLIHDSVQYWLTAAPDRIKTYNFIGIESEKEHGIALRSAEKIEKLKRALQEYDAQIQSVSPEDLKSLEEEIGHILGEKRSIARESEKRVVQRFPSSESQGMAQSQIQAARDLVLASRRRDQLIAERINHNIAGHGILTMGRAHKDSLAEFLIQTCERQPEAKARL